MSLLERLNLSLPIVQAPMAGVSTPELAASVSNAGGLGSIAVGATNADGARQMIEKTRAQTDRTFQVNVFVHPEAQSDPVRETAWLNALRPEFEAFGAQPPESLHTIYKSFAEDDEMLEVLLALPPRVVGFHFGLPSQQKIAALKGAGCLLFATATNLKEAQAAEKAGIDALVAQGWEAGGHRGMFDPDAEDERLTTHELVRLLVSESPLPVVAAGGIMDGSGIKAVLDLGATAAQLGTAFVSCPETSADEGYRTAIANAKENGTVMTSAISGRPARCIVNRFTEWGEKQSLPVPDYPITYDAGKALNQVAKASGENAFGAQWAGQGVAKSRPMKASDLMETLNRELTEAYSR